MTEITYNIQCSSTVDWQKHVNQENLQLMIKRTDNDKKIQDGKQYFNKIVILANNLTQPMLYVANDYNRVVSSKVWYMIYRIKRDTQCKYVSLRIMSEKADEENDAVLVQVLEFAMAKQPHERMINLAKLEVLSEQIIIVPLHQILRNRQNQIPLDMSCLHINRIKND